MHLRSYSPRNCMTDRNTSKNPYALVSEKRKYERLGKNGDICITFLEQSQSGGLFIVNVAVYLHLTNAVGSLQDVPSSLESYALV